MNDALIVILKLLAVLALVGANGFFVAAEFSLVALRRSRVDEMVQKGVMGARAVQHATRNLDRAIAATQLGITLASLALGWLGEPTLGHLLERLLGHAPAGPTLAVVIAFTIITSLHIVAGELTPKSIALQYPERTALVVAQPLALFDAVLRPAIVSLNGTGRLMVRLLGLHPPAGHELVHSADELKMLVEASGRAGALEESEQAIIGRAFGFADISAHEVMVPRTEVAAISAATPGPALLGVVREHGYSRYPVYEGSLDQVVGVLHVKDLLGAVQDGTLDQCRAGDFAREVLFVPETLPMDGVLEQMRERNLRMAIVIDEFGGTAGVVTMENLIEQLVGRLRDEFERRPEPEAMVAPDGSAVLSGLTTIGAVNEMLGLHLDDSAYDTIGGYVFGHLGRLPEPGDRIAIPRYEVRVEAMDGRRIDRVRLTPTATPSHGAAGSAPESGPEGTPDMQAALSARQEQHRGHEPDADGSGRP